MDAIIATIPWCCGERDCSVQWHISNYWAYEDGTYTIDQYADGDHEGCDMDDIPSANEINLAWLSYFEYVAQEGLDPLDEFQFLVRSMRTVKERWRIRFSDSILGPLVIRAHRGVQSVSVLELPQHVKDYLLIKPDADTSCPVLDMTWKELIELPDVKKIRGRFVTRQASISFLLERRVPRSAAVVARELRKAARARLSHSRP